MQRYSLANIAKYIKGTVTIVTVKKYLCQVKNVYCLTIYFDIINTRIVHSCSLNICLV